MSAPPFSIRLSPALRQLLIDVAGSEDAADALRALLILGATQAGLDTAALRRDTAAVLALELTPGVQTALQAVYSQGNTKRIQSEYNVSNGRSEPTMDDPLGNIGIEV